MAIEVDGLCSVETHARTKTWFFEGLVNPFEAAAPAFFEDIEHSLRPGVSPELLR
jgi:hypothetical protein